MKKKRRGFTLIETVTTLFIVSLLATLIIPNVANVRQAANKRQSDAMVHMIQGQIAMYYEGSNKANVNYKELIDGGYLSEAQVKSAEEADIYIKNGQAIKGDLK
jgi:competence protein ComGC